MRFFVILDRFQDDNTALPFLIFKFGCRRGNILFFKDCWLIGLVHMLQTSAPHELSLRTNSDERITMGLVVEI